MPRARLLLAAVVLLLPQTAAATAAGVHLTAVAVPATAHVGSVVVVSGSVTPAAAETLAVQRFSAHTWITIGHTHSTKAGHYTVSLRAPHTATTWQLRVVHAKTLSATVRVHVVTKQFIVRASVSGTDPLTVTGTITPKATGTVALQALQHNTWRTLTTARLTTKGGFTLTKTEPAGPYTLRVVKTYTTTIAGGTSKSLHASVPGPLAPPTAPPTIPAAPSITTTRLPLGTVGIAYSATLKAVGGALPLTWAVGSGALPAGLALTAGGQITGEPTSAASLRLTVTVTDALGRSASLPLGLTVGTGVLRTWGSGVTSPTLVTGPGPIISAVGGYEYWLAVGADHTIWGFGEDGDGQLGDGTTSVPTAPVHDTALSGVVSVAAEELASYALLSTGSVYSWGFNAYGNLGDGTTSNSLTPRAVLKVTGAVGIAAVNNGAFAVESNGTVWAWGHGDNGTLGDGTSGTARSTPVQVSGLTSAVAVSGGEHTAYALLSNGTVAAWGDNSHSQLGDGTSVPQSDTPVIVKGLTGVVAVAASSQGALALKSDGTVWAWGYSLSGFLGDNGLSETNTPVLVPGLRGITSIASGGSAGYALDGDGTEWAWGGNVDDELGNGTEDNNPVPGPISGLGHVVAIGGGFDSNGSFAVTW